MRNVVLLGASGSIGSQTLDLLGKDRLCFTLRAFSLGTRVEQIPAILKEFPTVTDVCVMHESDAKEWSARYPSIRFYHGDEGLREIIDAVPCDLVVNALVGFAGLLPSVHALEKNKILCLANKESLVVGGQFINRLLQNGKGKLYPIDSEHVGLAKCLARVSREDIESVWITASGGSFRSLSRSELENVTPEMALNHPTWKMGAKITIDCATMMNKGFEVIEANVLFGYPLERTHIQMHGESCIHAFVKKKDGSIVADVSSPDMHGPIAYALYEGKAPFEVVHAKRLEDLGPYTFFEFNPSRYPAVGIALEAYRRGGTAPAILNAANEVAVHGFLEGKLPFLGIEREIEIALSSIPVIEDPSLRDVLEADLKTRHFVRERLEKRRS